MDTNVLADILRQAQDATVTDTTQNSDSVSFSVENIVRLLDTLVSNSSNYNQLNAINYLAVVAVFKDTLDPALFESLSDTGQFFDTLTTNFTHILNELDTCLFEDSNSSVNYINVSLADVSVASANLSNTAELFEYLIDSSSWYASLGLDGNDYLVYAMNTQTNSVTEYDNFIFNSMSENLAVSSDGIYELSGNDDDGTAIDASIKTGLLDFGESHLKKVPYAYLGIDSDGEVLLKAVSVNRGVKEEHWYRVVISNDAFDTTRVDLGKGVKSRYWQFELVNNNGADFELESMELLPLVLSRRIR